MQLEGSLVTIPLLVPKFVPLGIKKGENTSEHDYSSFLRCRLNYNKLRAHSPIHVDNTLYEHYTCLAIKRIYN